MERIKFLELIEFFPIGITISDSEGNLIESNKEGARLLGLKKEEHTFWTLDDPKWHVIRKDYTVMPPEEYPSVRALKEKIRVENVEIGIVKAGEITWINITAAPLPGGDGVIVAYLDISKNISREKELEELINDRSKFLNIIAHDLRNPFNTIIGFTDLLLEDITKYPIEKIEKYLQVIRNTSKQTFELLENLLEWSRSRAGTLEYKPDYIDLTLLVTSTLHFLKNHAEQKNIRYCYNYDKHCVAYADKNMMDTVMRNLITNAIKYSYPGNEITISVKDSSDHVAISIKDKGTGMDEETRKLLFEKNQKISTPGTEKEKGTGLGLIICKEFIARHNGKIHVESEKGKGSEFIVKIPKQPS